MVSAYGDNLWLAFVRKGDVIMCAMLAMVVPAELKLARSRIARLVEAYIGGLVHALYSRFRTALTV